MSSVESIHLARTNDNHTPRSFGRSTSSGQATPRPDPWTPIVLSLDGGGIRGLSELFILKKIIDRIRELIEEDGVNPFSIALHPANVSPPAGSSASTQSTDNVYEILPCYLFDYMVGTSTGGLIAVMLGRLRMNMDDSIKAYWRLGNKVFRPPRSARPYSATKLRGAILDVVRDNCGCHSGRGRYSPDRELLRQYDYSEDGNKSDISFRTDPSTRNYTCKVALVAKRKVNKTEATHLFRSYNHVQRLENSRSELIAGAFQSDVKIWEACRATSAAPYYFPNMKIKNDKFLDGGAGYNNPSTIAWNEAKWMSNFLTPDSGDVAAVVSLGCGEKERIELFGNTRSIYFIYKVFKRGKNEISNTQNAHEATENVATSNNSAYFRFNVPPVEGDDGHRGLRDVKTCECKKKAKRSLWDGIKESLPFPSKTASDSTIESERPAWYTALEEEAAGHDQEKRKGGFKPHKYHYPTYDTIFERTDSYCHSRVDDQDVAAKIDSCARLLFEYAKRRQENDPERWKRFVSHPNPAHPLHLFNETATP